MSSLFGDLVAWVLNIIDVLGYPGLALVVAIENVFPPIPSEVILPLAGFLASDGRMSFAGALIGATVGSVLGALILYWFGYAFGEQRVRALTRRYGRWAMVTEEDLDKSQAWFDRHGRKAVLLGRLAPLVRSLISIPAGINRMPLAPFIIYTTIGSGIWNFLLIGGGWVLGENWGRIEQYQKYFQYLVVAAIGLAILYFLFTRLMARRRAGYSAG
jgi:membrane protein DedA with SNARE-associated domain